MELKEMSNQLRLLRLLLLSTMLTLFAFLMIEVKPSKMRNGNFLISKTTSSLNNSVAIKSSLTRCRLHALPLLLLNPKKVTIVL